MTSEAKRVLSRFKKAELSWVGEKDKLCRIIDRATGTVLMLAVPRAKERPADTERRCWADADARYAKEVRR